MWYPGGGGGGLKCPHTALIKSKCKNSRQKLKENCDKELFRAAAPGERRQVSRGLRRRHTVAHPAAVYRQNTRVNILTISGHCARGRALIALANHPIPPHSLLVTCRCCSPSGQWSLHLWSFLLDKSCTNATRTLCVCVFVCFLCAFAFVCPSQRNSTKRTATSTMTTG